MAGIRFQPEDSDASQISRQLAAIDLISDDDRSVAADSWSIKSDYGSTLDDEQRHVDAAEALSAASFRASSDYNSDKDESDSDAVPSMLGFQSYWDAAYADELVNFREHGHTGEVWFGADVMEKVASWTKNLCLELSQRHLQNHNNTNHLTAGQSEKDLPSWSVLDIGTGNGLLLQELAKQGFTDLTGTDYSEGAIDLARSLAGRDGFTNIKFLVLSLKRVNFWESGLDEQRFNVAMLKTPIISFWRKVDCDFVTRKAMFAVYILACSTEHSFVSTFYLGPGVPQVDDVLETKLDRKFQLVTDKGTLDAIGLHPDGHVKRMLYWDSISGIVTTGGLLVITSCNSTKDELIQEVEAFNQRKSCASQEPNTTADQNMGKDPPPFQYVDHIRSYPTFTFGGSAGSRVATVAFLRN